VNAIAAASGFTQSTIGSASYTLQSPAATPFISPASGTSFANSLSVSIADSTPGATIYYTTNGSAPTTSSSVYFGPYHHYRREHGKSNCYCQQLHAECRRLRFLYLANPGGTPLISPATGTSFATSLSVSVADSTRAPTHLLQRPTEAPLPPRAPASTRGRSRLPANTHGECHRDRERVHAKCGRFRFLYPAIRGGQSTFSPASGTTFTSTLSVSIADSTPGATIYYKTNGSAPTTSSSVYSGAITISASSTVQAIAGGNGFTSSGVASASYTSTTGEAGVVSDNLDEPSLNTSLWTLENPLGDGTVTMNAVRLP